VNTIDKALQDPQVLHRNMVEEIDHPTAGRIKLTGIPVKMSETPAEIRLPPPTLGQHTDEVLRNVLGYDEGRIDSLRSAEVI
jgi:crotonobetainyl-CoA:carnitine CoA-transferase CaiB-like acyl-CoA transferase